MSTSAEKTSWRWQLEQLQQQLGEWIEVKLRSNDGDSSVDLFPAWLGPFLVRLTWAVLAGLLIWFIYRFIYPVCLRWWQARNQNASVNFRSINSEEPAPVYTVAELLIKSQQFQATGDYTQASRWLYLAMLQRLNDAKLIPHQFSRTDREYQELLRALPLIDIGTLLVSIHEQLHFGDEQIGRSDFDQCQQAYQKIDLNLDQLTVNQPATRDY
jgi:Domain of unknown function (DUF4129)